MKLNKRLANFIVAVIMIINLSILNTIQIFAHDIMLEVGYDNCIDETSADGIDEMWYALNKNSFCYHLSDGEETIKYFFEETSDSGYSWTTDVSSSVAEEIKTAYANSMKKWNNVYFYSYDSYGNVVKCKLINVVEGTASDHNLSIYPGTSIASFASTIPVGDYDVVETGEVSHLHYSEWEMTVNINNFYASSQSPSDMVALVRERTGAHELGHVLGLQDLDHSNLCNSDTTTWHHHEVLMGYGAPVIDRMSNITYKDIAGVAILRGFHTDYDHKWLNCGLQSDGKYKLLCSICNGVKCVDSLSDYSYYTYNACGGNHNLSSGNMMAVASYKTQDYYKCKYCRYVAPFSSLVSQNYVKTDHTDTLHKCSNNVSGLAYSFLEAHEMTHVPCNNNNYHRDVCVCGHETTTPHIVSATSSKIGKCILCGATVTIGNGTIMPWGNGGFEHTIN